MLLVNDWNTRLRARILLRLLLISKWMRRYGTLVLVRCILWVVVRLIIAKEHLLGQYWFVRPGTFPFPLGLLNQFFYWWRLETRPLSFISKQTLVVLNWLFGFKRFQYCIQRIKAGWDERKYFGLAHDFWVLGVSQGLTVCVGILIVAVSCPQNPFGSAVLL